MIRYRSTWDILCQFVMCLSLFLASCAKQAENPEDLSGFYFPIESLDSAGTIYSYRSLVDTNLANELWLHVRSSEGHLTSINYDENERVLLKQYERRVANGILLDSLHFYMYDTIGRSIAFPVRVLSPHRFPFNAKDSTQVWLTHLEWWEPGDTTHVVLQRRRRFLGDTTWQWQGKNLQAKRFRLEDKFETEKVGWTTAEWRGEEIYAKNIGLVYYRRNITAQMTVEFQLDQIKPWGEK